MFLIVGLGNPGRNYEKTRHNAGFLAVDRIAARFGIHVDFYECTSLTGRGSIEGESVVLAKPQTFMNRSGEAVRCLVARYRVDLTNLIVIYDDIDLPLGKVRIRTSGGAGGHKGMVSIIHSLGTENFPRIRLGIDRPKNKDTDIVNYVLSPFTQEELIIFEESLEKAVEAIRLIFRKGYAAAMSVINAG